MRFVFRSALVILTLVLVSAAPRAQEAPAPAGAPVSLDAVIDRVIKSEAALASRMAMYRPRTEVYMQHLEPDQTLGAVPIRDDYYLGEFLAADAPDVSQLTSGRGWFRASGLMDRPYGFDYVPSGFALTTMPDRRGLDRTRYQFRFVRREFLDEVRTMVVDVQPIDDREGFKGRLWIDDREYTIVRFNGISRELDGGLSSFFRRKLSFHIDSWRVNVRPGEWLPAYVYFEETDFSEYVTERVRVPRLRGQMRLWGYELTSPAADTAFTQIQVGGAVDATGESGRQPAPVGSQRRWETEAENNILDRLYAAGLLAPPGPVDGVLETVLNNLQVTNELAYEPELKVRVLMTTALESFVVGRTIVVSRGLIDVLPDEASLAMVLAHELSHVALGHLLIDTRFGFADRLMIPDAAVIPTLMFSHTPEQETEADAKVLELLGKSPYQDKLAVAGLFLRQVTAHARALPNLVRPHFGDYIRGEEESLMQLVSKSPELAPAQLDQIAALPLGARVVMDPWSSSLDLNRSPAVPIYWAREKLQLAVTPMAPYQRYAENAAPVSSR
jgi:hypothetical protein